MRNKFFVDIATLGIIGYLPAPGTAASIFCLPLVYLISQLGSLLYLFSTLLILFISFFIADKALVAFKNADPPEIVIDELVGILITFLFIKVSILNLLLGLVLFRIFDIFKLGLKKVEKLPWCYGLILDDVLAGAYSCILLHLINHLIFS